MSYQPEDFTFWLDDWADSEGSDLTEERFWAVGSGMMKLLDDPRAQPAAPIPGMGPDMWIIDFPNVPGRLVAAWYVIDDRRNAVVMIALDNVD